MAAAILAAGTAVGAPPPVDSVVGAESAFALDLYRQLAGGPGNRFFSPYSLARILALTATGARGPTAAGMDAALRLELPAVQVAAGFRGLAAELQSAAGDDAVLLGADSLWVQDRFPLRAEFLQVARNQFDADVTPADFVHDPEGARTAINGWVDAHTQGKIAQLIAPGGLTATTRVVLCDAIYFMGKWQHRFKAEQTHPAPFHFAPQSTAEVATMRQTAAFRSAHLDAVGLLELPYLGQRLSMVILLPDATDGLPELERQLSAARLREWLTQLDSADATRTSVLLPRFTARETLELAGTLKALGMTRAFDPNGADFSGIADEGLFISDVIHQAYVKVDEEGTEAAAASGVVMFAAAAMVRVPEFRVDHPFIFLIRDSTTGTILFLGRIVDPR